MTFRLQGRQEKVKEKYIFASYFLNVSMGPINRKGRRRRGRRKKGGS
jgi:hypothetical protein